MRELIFLEPVFKSMIWGGERLKKDFNYDVQGDNIGECWAISAHENGDCAIASKSYKGMTLSELWSANRELFGNMEGKKFPLLIKIIDAKTDLSIQVHPDDEYAGKNENGSLGKTECWYVLDCDEDATIVIGHNAKDKDELKEMIEGKRWSEFIREIPVHKGDFFQIEPGCLHAIKGGTMILETQQNSDITYRVYDYDRLQNGKPRELHVKQSIDVINAPFKEIKNETAVKEYDGYTAERLITCEFYTVERMVIKSKAVVEQNHNFVNVSVINGGGTVDGIPIKKGSHFIIPFGYGDADFKGDMEIIISYV